MKAIARTLSLDFARLLADRLNGYTEHQMVNGYNTYIVLIPSEGK